MNKIDFEKNTSQWLDRLACGEISSHARRELLAWLESEPLRWRACALALLESQTWSESLDAWQSNSPQEPNQKVAVISARVPSATRSSWIHWGILAASVLLAFALGVVSRSRLGPEGAAANHGAAKDLQSGEAPTAGGPVMATVSFRPEMGPNISATIQIPVVAMENQAAEPAKAEISEYDRQIWQRRGYELTKEKRFIPAELPGGKKVMVPVEQVKANYVGSKVS